MKNTYSLVKAFKYLLNVTAKLRIQFYSKPRKLNWNQNKKIQLYVALDLLLQKNKLMDFLTFAIYV